MNLVSEEHGLSLFRYIPEATSQLLIQASEPQELVPVPGICDDLLLTDLEAGGTWTLGALPVLLNAPFPPAPDDAPPFEPSKSPLAQLLPDADEVADDVDCLFVPGRARDAAAEIQSSDVSSVVAAATDQQTEADAAPQSERRQRRRVAAASPPHQSLVEILNLDGTTTILQLDGPVLGGEQEPDSTVAGDGGGNDPVSLGDIAEVVMSFRCKRCNYCCDDRDRMLQHHRHSHGGPGPGPAADKKIMRPKRRARRVMAAAPGPEPPAELTIFLCSECGGQFASVEACRAHMIQDHGMFPADECGIKCEDTGRPEQQQQAQAQAEALQAEAEQAAAEAEARLQNVRAIERFTSEVLRARKVKCTVRGCPYRFARAELLARHEACHVEGARGQFRCPECGMAHEAWRACSLHLWQCHRLDVDLYACPLCEYRAPTANKLKNHVKIHGDERDFVCGECGRGFKQAAQLRNHRVRHLDKAQHAAPRWYTQKRCDACGKIFADSKCLKKHTQAVHSKLKPFICNVCGHSCSRKAMLQMHLRQHTGEKPYACPLCLYRTGDHNSLRRHAMRHSGVRPYKCPHCAYTAIQSNSYKNHLASKHPGMAGSYSCTQCPFKTVSDDAFTCHVNGHLRGAEQAGAPDTQPAAAAAAAHHQPDEDEDEARAGCFLSLADLADEQQPEDTGGITIPADEP